MIRDGICHNGRTQLNIVVDGILNAYRYSNEIIDPISCLVIRQGGFNHVSYRITLDVTWQWCELTMWNKYSISLFLALSSDHLTIEHLWDQLCRRVLKRQNPPKTLQGLLWVIIQEWNNILLANIMSLIGSMRRRFEAVVAARDKSSILNSANCNSG